MWMLLLACTQTVEEPLDAGLFTSELGERLERRLTRYEVSSDEELVLHVVSPDGFELDLDLRGLFEDCQRPGFDCEQGRIAWVERQGRNAQARSEPFRLGLLRPRVMRAEEAKALELPSEPLLGELVVVPSLDAPSASRGVTAAELRVEELELEAALAQARRQLEAEAELNLELLPGAARVLYSPRAADLLLVDSLWSEGQLVLPAQSGLLLIGEEPERLLELASELADANEPWLSEAVLVRTSTGWQAR